MIPMRRLSVLLVVMLSIFISCKEKKSLIGKWQRVDLSRPNNDSFPPIPASFLTIAADSTFFLDVGLDSNSTTHGTGGWSPQNERGKWQVRDSILFLSLQPMEDHMILNYKIQQLTSDKLVLRARLAAEINYPDMEYKRVD